MSNIWIVVADCSRARIFSADKPAGPLSEIETLSNPGGRLHEGDLVSDRGGRDSNGASGTHGYSTGKEAKEEEANRFAAEVCQQLEKGRTANAFGKLYVIAAPTFLGLLRKHQSTSLKALLAGEIAKDITTQAVDRIRGELPEYL